MKRHILFIGAALLLSFTSTVTSQIDNLWTNIFQERLTEAQQGSSDAQFEVAAMYENGRGIKQDRSTALAWYKKAAEQGHSRASGAIARIQDNERRFHKTHAQAEGGDIEAQYSLGTMFLTGTGVDLDLSQAQLWLSRAAARGHIKAQFKLGHLYYVDLGDETDNQAAHEWFKKSADQGYAHAMYYLGEMHNYGAGVTKDYNLAREWYTKAREAGFSLADKSLKALDEQIAAEKRQEQEDAARALQEIIKQERLAKTTSQKPASEPTITLTTQQKLMRTQWQDGKTHAKFLPSQISQCTPGHQELVCYSKELARPDLPHVRYRVKAILRNFTTDGTFSIVYRELVLATQSADSAEQGNSDTDNAALSTGWLEPHRLNCKLGDDNALTCQVDDGSIKTFKGA